MPDQEVVGGCGSLGIEIRVVHCSFFSGGAGMGRVAECDEDICIEKVDHFPPQVMGNHVFQATRFEQAVAAFCCQIGMERIVWDWMPRLPGSKMQPLLEATPDPKPF